MAMSKDAAFLGAASRLILLIFSVYLFHRTSSPPVRKPNLPPLGPSLSEKREWFLLRFVIYGYPFIKLGYVTATFLECLSVAIEWFDNPTSLLFLVEYLPLPTGTSQSPGFMAMLGLLMGVVGGLLRISSYKALGNSFTFNITRSSPKLVTSGPYSLVRHPSYLGMLLFTTGVTVYHLSPGSWVRESDILRNHALRTLVGLWTFMTVIVTNVCSALRMEDEDELMKKMFEEEWEAWRKVVRYKLLPGLY